MCARNIHGGLTNPQLPLGELKLADIQKILPPEFVRQLKKIYLCGNYGDPVASSEVLEILDYLRATHPGIQLGIHTNGGARDSAWWTRLAQLVTYCRFGIDGLADTNHLYRQGVNWTKLMDNAQAFIAAGGRAEWDYLVFEHNQHQVSEANALADRMGFAQFQVKSTSRFFDGKRGTVLSEYSVHNSKGLPSHLIKPSTLPQYQNKALEQDYADVVQGFGSVEKYWDEAEIECRVGAEKSIYVSAEGLIFPCCWTANQLYSSSTQSRANAVWKLLETLPLQEQSLSAKTVSLKGIVEGDFFQSVLPETWNKKSVAEGKLQVCAKTCGKCVKPFESQFVSS
jgi:MoaA/NifB/PqqE/SkfB family radical SAM enzyme